jgi:hypothetical protein
VRVGGGRIECRRGSHGLGADLARAAVDLSQTGACLVLKAALERGQEVELIIHGHGLPRPLRRLGRVVWAVPADDGCRVGIHFANPIPYMDLQSIAAPPRVLR